MNGQVEIAAAQSLTVHLAKSTHATQPPTASAILCAYNASLQRMAMHSNRHTKMSSTSLMTTASMKTMTIQPAPSCVKTKFVAGSRVVTLSLVVAAQ